MKIIAKVYGMDVKRSKRKLIIEGKQIDLLVKHLRKWLPNMVFLDETEKEFIDRAIRIQFGGQRGK